LIYATSPSFYWTINLSSKLNQLNSNDNHNRKPDDYSRNDVNNEIRAGIRLISTVLGMVIAVPTIGILLTPVVSPLTVAA